MKRKGGLLIHMVGIAALGMGVAQVIGSNGPSADRCGYWGCQDPVLIQDVCDPSDPCFDQARYWWNYWQCGELPC